MKFIVVIITIYYDVNYSLRKSFPIIMRMTLHDKIRLFASYLTKHDNFKLEENKLKNVDKPNTS